MSVNVIEYALWELYTVLQGGCVDRSLTGRASD